MNKLYDLLIAFLIKNKVYNEKYIKYTGLERICLTAFKNNKEYYLNILLKIANQKMDNNWLKKEIVEIANIMKANSIKVVFLKGLPFAEELYDKAEIRKTNDIDILIDIDQAAKALDLLGERGYYVKRDMNLLYKKEYDEKVSFEGLKQYFSEFNNYRLEFQGFYRYTKKNKILNLDCHLKCLNTVNTNSLKINTSIINRARNYSFYKEKIFVLELYDNIIFLCDHYIKDVIRNNILCSITGWKKIRFYQKINLLYDIALLIDKYSNNLDWSELYRRIKLYNKQREILYTFKLLTGIYTDLIPWGFADSLLYNRGQKDELMMYTILDILLERSAEENLLLGDASIMNIIFKEMNYNGNDLFCDNLFYITKPQNEVHHGRAYFAGKNKNAYGTGVINVDSDYLYLSLQLKTKHIKYYPLLSIYLSDLSFKETYECYIPRIQILIENLNGNTNSKLLVNNKPIQQENFCEVIVSDAINIKIKLRWDIFDIKSFDNLIFNIEVEERNQDNGNPIRSTLEWMVDFDLKYFGKVILT